MSADPGSVTQMLKVQPPEGYPPEEGCYLRGNDYSPVAVLVILKWIREETPPGIEALVRVGLESGAALSGTLQTENIGLEKVIANVVANPNIRYLVVCGPESPGHLVGEAILALGRRGVGHGRRIVGSTAPTPFLFNLPIESIERFRRQVTVIDLIGEGDPDVIRSVVQACYQEEPTAFRDLLVHDVGAHDEPPICRPIMWRITDPAKEPKSDEERTQVERARALIERVKRAAAEPGACSDPSHDRSSTTPRPGPGSRSSRADPRP
jgi:tetrahydromethanopterin S-methyltransferase subunit A